MRSQPTLGVLTVHSANHPPFPEASFFEQMSTAGIAEGIRVVVFHPNELDFTKGKVHGYQFDPTRGWQKKLTTIPRFIYDRCFYTGKDYNSRYKPYVAKLQSVKGIRFLGVALKGKWQLFQLIKSHPKLAEFLPYTVKAKQLSQSQVVALLEHGKPMILKPINGSLGVGIMKVTKESNSHIVIEGRDYKNTPYTQTFSSLSSAAHFVNPQLAKYQYLMQPFLSLSTKQGRPFDLRVFIQKDKIGQWTVTGKAIRVGKKDSITSNLHGGGKAYPVSPFLGKHFSQEQITEINKRICYLEQELPLYLEGNHGPLVELGVDIGIDQEGRVWLIEVNSRPGRDIFKQIGDQKALTKSQLNPLYYALHLMQT